MTMIKYTHYFGYKLFERGFVGLKSKFPKKKLKAKMIDIII